MRTSPPNPHGNLPVSGAPVRCFGSMGDANHTPEICAERAKFNLSTFKEGQIIRRWDGCVMILDIIEPPDRGGNCSGYGRPYNQMTGETRGSWGAWSAGLLGGCEILRQPTTSAK